MAAEELAANQRAEPGTDPVARDVARWASSRQLAPGAMAAIALGFGAIAAVWLTAVSLHAGAIAVAALAAALVAGRAGRLMAGQQAAAATEWGLAACAVLTELAVYAGIAGGASANAASAATAGLSGPAGSRLHGTVLARFGGPGTDGVWRLAVAAAVMLALLQMAAMCLASQQPTAGRARRLQAFAGTPGGVRLLLIGGVAVLAGARATFLLLLALGVLALGAMLAAGSGTGVDAGTGAPAGPAGGGSGGSRSAESPAATSSRRLLVGYRGDGPLAVWMGRFVDGRLPPLPPLIVGLLVTGMLAGLGLQNLPGILVLTPVEAMLLAALGSWHAHDGRHDWLAPPLLQAGEYLFIAAAGFAGRVWPPVTFALIAAVMMRHIDLAYRARGGWPGTDWRGLGWEGRMIVAGLAAVFGIQPVIYPLLALYLWGLLAWDWVTGWRSWSAGHAAVDR